MADDELHVAVVQQPRRVARAARESALRRCADSGAHPQVRGGAGAARLGIHAAAFHAAIADRVQLIGALVRVPGARGKGVSAVSRVMSGAAGSMPHPSPATDASTTASRMRTAPSGVASNASQTAVMKGTVLDKIWPRGKKLPSATSSLKVGRWLGVRAAQPCSCWARTPTRSAYPAALTSLPSSSPTTKAAPCRGAGGFKAAADEPGCAAAGSPSAERSRPALQRPA